MNIKNILRTLKFLFTFAFVFLVIENIAVAAQKLHPLESNGTARSFKTLVVTKIEFRNETNNPKRLYWLNADGKREFFKELAPQSSISIDTYLLTAWIVTDRAENAIALYYPDAQPRIIRISDDTASNVSDEDDDFSVEEKYRNAANALTICRDQSVPRGFLIVSVGSDMKCSNWSAIAYNTLTIKRLSRTEPVIVCQNQTLPRNFVITSVGSNMSCPGWTATGSNTMTIRLPRETEDVCSTSQIPRGYVVVANSSNMSCPNWSAVGSNVKRIKRIE